jgi:hypothetical protein
MAICPVAVGGAAAQDAAEAQALRHRPTRARGEAS